MVAAGILLALLVLVFFAPIRYRSVGSKFGDECDIRAWITYLNPLVRVLIHYPDEMIVRVKVFGFTVYKMSADEETAPGKEVSENPKGRVPEESKSKATEKAEDNLSEKSEDKVTERREDKILEEPDRKRTKAAEQKTEDVDAKQSSEEQNPAKNSALDTATYYTSLLAENRTLILDILKTVLKACKTILPGKCFARAVYGTGQADITGFIYGAYCSVREYLPGEIYLEPVWTETCLEGEYSLKGKIRLIHFLVAIIKIVADKNCRLLWKRLRRA